MSSSKCDQDHRFGYRVRGKATKQRRKRAKACAGDRIMHKPARFILWLGFPEWRDAA